MDETKECRRVMPQLSTKNIIYCKNLALIFFTTWDYCRVQYMLQQFWLEIIMSWGGLVRISKLFWLANFW